MKLKTGDRVVKKDHGNGTIITAGINGVCRVQFDSGTIAIVKTIELSKLFLGAK